jgi:hypothetical protein
MLASGMAPNGRSKARIASGRRWGRSLPGLALLVLTGCGSMRLGELPPAAAPPRSPPVTAAPAGRTLPREAPPSRPVATDGGRTLARVSPRARTLELYDARTNRRTASAPAGVGPTHVACLKLVWCYVTDTDGDALLVFRRKERVELVRRYYLPGGPYGLALDRRRRLLYVTLPGRNELVQLPAHGRPHVLRRWPTVRQPDAVSVDESTERVIVTGDSASQVVRP